MERFFSHGKLLITGEYFVLDGSFALALPTKKGQDLVIEPHNKTMINWKSLDHEGQIWYQNTFSIEDKKIQPTLTDPVSLQLQKLLSVCKELNPEFLTKEDGYIVQSQLEFPRNWGLGSSSTLINNLAQWANVNPFQLLEKGFGGSGYDIAVAQTGAPLLYRNLHTGPEVTLVNIDWNFTENLFFIHLNEKQDSKVGIQHYRQQTIASSLSDEISQLTQKMVDVKSLEAFEEIIQRHEALVAKSLHLTSVKDRLFPDYPGTIKSLGAWGGDFVLAIGTEAEMSYFRDKGFETIIAFQEMIK